MILQNRYAAERAAVIRRQNVKRHATAGAVSKLREEIQRHTANRNRQFEHDRLLEASLRHNGLDRMGLARLAELKTLIAR